MKCYYCDNIVNANTINPSMQRYFDCDRCISENELCRVYTVWLTNGLPNVTVVRSNKYAINYYIQENRTVLYFSERKIDLHSISFTPKDFDKQIDKFLKTFISFL